MEYPVQKGQFDEFPYISSAYFKLGFDKNFPKQGLIKSNEGEFELNLGVPDSCDIVISIYDVQNKVWITPHNSVSDDRGNKTVIRIELKDSGHYLIKVSAINNNGFSFTITGGILYYTLLNE